jgi:electron-transferring-flavoprotein dehydrogenase
MTERQVLEADIVCVGFGPATAGFLSTLAPHLVREDGSPALDSQVLPGMPLQVIAFERADGLGFGVSGIVTRARAIRASMPAFDPSVVPMATPVARETIVYLLDPVGASRRSAGVRALDLLARSTARLLPSGDHAVELPLIPGFLRKDGGLLLSMGQFMQWVSERLMSSGAVQVWPASPVAGPLFEGRKVVGVRLVDQGTERDGSPTASYSPGMDVRARLTVVGDGPVGAVGEAIDRVVGVPAGYRRRDWAVGVKMVVGLRPDCGLEAGTVLHTLGYPEPEMFGFLYVHDGGTASLGLIVPSSFDSPVRTAYRYLQHWILHPYLWQFLRGGEMRSWGAKTLQESGRHAEPFLVGDGYARVGEGAGSTNVLTGSGVDEAWMTGVLLAEGVAEIAQAGRPFTRENLEAAYVARRRASWLDRESRAAANARTGFRRGVLRGLVGMAAAGLTRGVVAFGPGRRLPHERVSSLEEYVRGRIGADELARITVECRAANTPLHDAVMDRCGWPAIPLDGTLLVSHQDALLVGGKVQAAGGYADHVAFIVPDVCTSCGAQVCVEACSGQALTPGPQGAPLFDREKCVHCGACYWNCSRPGSAGRPANVDFRAGAGGLHSAEN